MALVGEHDAYSAGRLDNELGVLLDEGRRVVIDLRDAEFIDSTTLSAMLRARQRAEKSALGFALVLAGHDYTQVHHLLDLTGLGSAFAIFPTLDDALSAARSGRNSGSVRSAA